MLNSNLKKNIPKDYVILGIDPGTAITGYGLIRKTNRDNQLIDYGCIRPPAKLPIQDRFVLIYEAIEHLLEKHSPDAVVVETQFFYKNAQSAMKLGMVRGITILAAARKKIKIYEYAPKKAKKAVVGNGSASKDQVQKMMQILFRLPQPPEPEDAADALALALCHAHALQFEICLNTSKGHLLNLAQSGQ